MVKMKHTPCMVCYYHWKLLLLMLSSVSQPNDAQLVVVTIHIITHLCVVTHHQECGKCSLTPHYSVYDLGVYDLDGTVEF